MDNTNTPSAEKEAEVIESKNFIENFIEEDLENGVFDKVQTRFPP